MSSEDHSAWAIIKARRWLFLMAAAVALAGSTVVSLSIPPVYASRTRIILEADDALYSPFSEQLARMGIDVETASDFTSDPFVYDKIVHSPSFLRSMAQVKVGTGPGGTKPTLAQYAIEMERGAWWPTWDKPSADERIARHIKCSTDLSTGIITLQATAQHAAIAKQLVDSAANHLQRAIAHYRAERANREVGSLEEQLQKAASRYHGAQKQLASFRDAHYGTLSPAAKAKEESLERESQRLYEAYNDMALRTERTRQAMQKATPAFTPLVESMVPVSASSPHWTANFLVWLFYCMMLTAWYVLYKARYGKKK